MKNQNYFISEKQETRFRISKFNLILNLFLIFIAQLTFAQDKNISGVVSDEVGPMLGVNVLKKGANEGVETNMDGTYSIKAKVGDILVFSFMGYDSVEKKIGTSTKINVTLKEASNQLSCVVLTASASRPKRILNYAKRKIKALSGRNSRSEVAKEYAPSSGDKFNNITERPFTKTKKETTSTFSIDADGASYSVVRRMLNEDDGFRNKEAVRTEELVNYFNLDYPYTDTSSPINLNGEVSSCPWNEKNKLVRIGIKGKPLDKNEMKNSNFVLLIDVSGSMGNEDKLQLLKSGFLNMIEQMSSKDKVSIVTYAGSAGVLLKPTSCDKKDEIKAAINSLGSGGSTAGAKGIITAYELAEENLINKGNNRIIIGTDGDFNVGPSSQKDLIKLIEKKRDKGIYLTVLGVGQGNLNDGMLEQLANNGNGNYEYIDNIEQLRKVFIYDYSKFYTVAKDVKVQVKFNPKVVSEYRLIGYENRALETKDFKDDEKDAGEIGANQNITALYEIVPVKRNRAKNKAMFTIKFRYKMPNANFSKPMSLDIFDKGTSFSDSSDFMKFTASVASYGLILRNSKYKGNGSYDKVINWLKTSKLRDEHNFKKEFLSIVEKTKSFK